VFFASPPHHADKVGSLKNIEMLADRLTAHVPI
jgi:hypothetical protein